MIKKYFKDGKRHSVSKCKAISYHIKAQLGHAGPYQLYLKLYSFFKILLLYWVGVHCGIYKYSYNTANISPSPFSFIPPSPSFKK
jgi:hypothetical protein